MKDQKEPVHFSTKTLIVAEKPSVAKALAAVVGASARHKACFVGPGCVVTWCIGHLVGIAQPGAHEERWAKWEAASMPIVPKRYLLARLEDTAEHFDEVAALLNDPSFGQVFNACDAGREGELIFRNVYDLSGSTLPIKRLWFASMTPEALELALQDVQDGALFDALADGARMRARADWLIGLNATRAATIAARSGAAGSGLISVGRVQTPTLGLIVSREREREAFSPKAYWVAGAELQAPGGERFQATAYVEGAKASSWERSIFDEAQASRVRAGLERVKQAQVLEYEEVVQGVPSPQFFDLTALQREANKRHGLTAKATLDALQSLYETHKLVTYPRTDSRHITMDVARTLPQRLRALTHHPNPTLGALAQKVLGEVDAEGLSKRLVNAEGVTDHHAILPTERSMRGGTLEHEEELVYEMVCRRTMAALAPAGVDAKASCTLDAAGIVLKAHGKVCLELGWRAYESHTQGQEEGGRSGAAVPLALPAGLTEGTVVALMNSSLQAKETKPPKRYTEAGLLAAMERALAGDGEELDQALRASGGLGTPATRASTIETIVARGYIARDGKSLKPTTRGQSVVALLERSCPSLLNVELTAKWECALGEIEEGVRSAASFGREVEAFAADLTHALLLVDTSSLDLEAGERVGVCPACSADVVLRDHIAVCSARRREDLSTCQFLVFREIAGKTLTSKHIQDLLAKGSTREIKGFVSSKAEGKQFSARVVLGEDDTGEWKTTLVFKPSKRRKRNKRAHPKTRRRGTSQQGHRDTKSTP